MDNFVELFKSYISADEKVNRLQQNNLKEKISKLEQQKFELEKYANKLINENLSLKETVRLKNLQIIGFAGALICAFVCIVILAKE